MNTKIIVGVLLIAAIAFIAMKRHTFNFGPQPNDFSVEALANKVAGLDGKSTTLGQVLEDYRGQAVVIDVWASWCGDCIKGLPKVTALQQSTEGQKVQYLFLSVDDDKGRWKRAIKKHDIQGAHYLLDGGWKSDFGNFLRLDWIPRYVVVDPQGKVALFKAISADDPKILKAINGELAEVK